MDTVHAHDVRNVTTIGHVDHGKTTLMDALLAANNIISSKMAGKIRYLDSREDEQQRGITMESSAVSLRFTAMEKTSNGGSSPKTYVVNMIDTPGHVDFSSEVSTASRLCDGALVLVDVVEGVCTQTITVLRQAWQDRLRPILVINKFDRLITELKLAPTEAHHHLTQLIEQVNAVMGSFFAGERMEDDLRWREERERRLAEKKEALADEIEAVVNEVDEFQEKDDEDIYFAPERDPKTKRVISHKHLRGRALKPMFVQFVLENIWAVYDAVVINPNPDKVTKIITALNLKIPARDLKTKDARHLLSLIFSQWLSLSTCIIQCVIDIVPPPSVAQRTRIPKMLYPDIFEPVEPKNQLEENLYSCNAASDARIVALVSKMFAVSDEDLPEGKRKPTTVEELRANANAAREARNAASEKPVTDGDKTVDGTTLEEVLQNMEIKDVPTEEPQNGENLLGFARIYSGTIRKGTTIACVLPKYNNAYGPTHPRKRNVFAIRGLEGKVWRNATLCAPGDSGIGREIHLEDLKDSLVNLGGLQRMAAPIVRVALEPEMPVHLPKLIRGLKLLAQADPCVETFQQHTGEHVILTAGELHLERCLKDLRERFAKIEISASKPIVPFRETAVRGVDMGPPKSGSARRGAISGASANNIVQFTIRATPLPKVIWDFLQENLAILRRMQQERKSREEHKTLEAEQIAEEDDSDEVDLQGEVIRRPTVRPEDFWSVLREKCSETGGDWEDLPEKVWAFGPQRAGTCLLIDSRNGGQSNSYKRRIERLRAGADVEKEQEQLDRDFDNLLETGFQLATFQGPLCAEPVEGMAYFVESLTIDREGLEKEREHNKMAQITGSFHSAVRDACRNGLLDWSPRLMLAMYECDIQASTDVLGKVYGVVAKLRVRALLPVVESFGFSDEIRTRTSGAASPQLIFSGYEMLDQDPFWVPTTEEELEDLGEKADRANVAKAYMDTVRARKGMFVDRKIIEFAEKQRTLKR
ncbi:hypothetical protein EW026_g4285 [Hermanssonia centrifuga]|uniref:Tr-type G domain-containing protein n=1 Tax=Hermanssonia centrifuga TaxID=98765 RepID=A0A4S4KHL8_9APHY|nr:hypothetical protein EW026_g4285 [Hermanssonia centrifuga]